ncbi:MAG: class I SAM-dependent methyltransferase [Pseudomonadota bacterium]
MLQWLNKRLFKTRFIRQSKDRFSVFPDPNEPRITSANLSVDTFLNTPAALRDRLSLLDRAFKCAEADGLNLEFGVFEGRSIRFLASKYSTRQFHGFDSFEGLPEAWDRSSADYKDAGHFAVPTLPSVPENVTLIAGWFNETLEPWLAENAGPIAFLHIDSDIYSSAIYLLTALEHRFQSGTVIVFDDLGDWTGSRYENWQDGEWRALSEWLASSGRELVLLGRGPTHSAAFRVV